MKTIRFCGIVRLATGVQRELCEALPQGRREELREQVCRAVQLVERTLGAHGASLKAVPGPTRRAYEFLRTIDFDQVAAGGEPSPQGPREVVLNGLTSRVERIADRLAQQSALGRPIHPEQQGVAAVGAAVEARLSRSGLEVEQLTARSREHLAWLRYLGNASNFQAYCDALRRATAIFDSIAASDRWPRPIVIHFRPTHSVFRARAEPDRTRVLLPTPMITLSDPEFVQLAHAVFGRRCRRHNAAVHAILVAAPYQQLRSRLESLAGKVEETRGMAYDLAEVFDRINDRYFAGQMPRPKLTWNRSFTAGKFGHYHYASDTVMISRTLDRPEVPAFVVDHVMHHELLHKRHGLRWHKGRSRAHTPEFRHDERQFERYQEADRFLQRLATGAPANGPEEQHTLGSSCSQ